MQNDVKEKISFWLAKPVNLFRSIMTENTFDIIGMRGLGRRPLDHHQYDQHHQDQNKKIK